MATAGLEGMIYSDGILELYESEAQLRGTAKDDAAKAAEGIEFHHVRGGELAELQPGLSPRITCGTFIPQWQTVSDPYDYALARRQSRHGARCDASSRPRSLASDPDSDGVALELADGTTWHAAQVVVAGGAWSKALTRAARGRHSARDRARLQHDAAAG